jgi:ribosomal protein S18 acetylase RimI-like enzyme
MDKKYKIRKAVEKDLTTLVEFLAKLALHVSGAPPQSLKEDARERLITVLRSAMNDNNKRLLVVDVPKQGLVGMGYVYVLKSQGIWEQTDHDGCESGIIDDVWIEPQFRKMGIFQELLRELVEFAHKRGAHDLLVEYSASNKEAAAAWTRLGFKTLGVRAAAWTSSVMATLEEQSGKRS